MLILLPLLGVLFNGLTTAHVEANLSLEFKATKLLRQHNPANCTVGNKTYAHGQTFKLDCKTQCVCENGRHACSSLCPKEQLPAPEDTISCRSPRLVEVPGHCCKMWLCENPTADVYATCHNASTSPWTPCSQPCGLGISTRFTSTNAGCRQLSSLRLCENRKCDHDNNNSNNNKNYLLTPQEAQQQQQQQPQKPAHAEHQRQQQQKQKQLISHNVANNLVVSEPKDIKVITNYHATLLAAHEEHRIRKGHECRSLQRLGPARIRLGACISRKLYRPKLCGLCHQHSGKCCRPSVSTTIQVELLCPLNADDPISVAEQQQQQPEAQAPLQLWDTVSLEPIDQEFLQSHQIQIENKFIAVEWILKCECGKYENCNNLQKYTTTMHNGTSDNSTSNSHKSTQQASNNNYNNSNNGINNSRNTVNSWRTSGTLSDRKNNKNVATNIISETARNNNGYAYNNNNNNSNNKNTNNKNNNAGISGGTDSGNNMGNMANSNDEQNIAADNDSDNRYVQQQQQQQQQQEEEESAQQEHLLSSSELQPDIIPYPAMLPPHRNNPVEKSDQRSQPNSNNNNSNDDINNNYNRHSNYREHEAEDGGNTDTIDSKRANSELNNNNNNNNIRLVTSAAGANKSKAVAGFGIYNWDANEGDDNSAVTQREDIEKPNERGAEQQNTLEEEQEQQQEDQQLLQWKFEKNLHYQQEQRLAARPTEPDAHWPTHYTHHHHQPHQRQHHHHHHQHHHHHLHHQQQEERQAQQTHPRPQLQHQLRLEQLSEQQQQLQPVLHALRQRST
ncbi:transcription factor mef2A [Zeugodacus cucurbitae]|uniref:transcription factor mef2A n=1 Tax=Zeugodacus cucurbitae TaxID=28588 RepID=UPI0023D9063D|nr:transcription factor mef2A [Zeugodacus cucurbitae]XP_028896156.2 transcription factor mef2A [Zeugodacus cucurbitae]